MHFHTVPAKRSLGQNFLIDPNIVASIVSFAGITKHSTVAEIGPGTGSLTQAIIGAKPGWLRLVELDMRLESSLTAMLAVSGIADSKLIMADAVTFNWQTLIDDIKAKYSNSKLKLIGNLPYCSAVAMVQSWAQYALQLPILLSWYKKKWPSG